MYSYSITPRDRVWAAIVKQQGQGPFQVADIREAIGGERPSDETIRRVLKSATELGVVVHRSGSPNYLAPEGIDTTEFLDLFPDERTEEVIDTEGDEEIDIEDIISEVRAAQLAQSEQLDNQVIEEHVRTRVQTFEAEAGTFEWDAQVEKLVDEVVDMVEPSDSHQQSQIAEWIRSRAREEVNSDGT